jgi:hypothetical protein
MPVLERWDLVLDTDAVLRGQGSGPAVIGNCNPQLVDIGIDEFEEVCALTHPKVLYERETIDPIRHAQLLLNGVGMLKSGLLTRQLGMAEETSSRPVSQSI